MQAADRRALAVQPPRRKRSTLFLASAVGAAVLWSTGAAAKEEQRPDQPPIHGVPTADRAPAPGEKAPALVVTGSRLSHPDGIGVSPLIVIDRKEFELAGTVNAEFLLNDLAQLYPGLTAFFNNGGDGSVKLDLRGFESARTLVLVNGRRWIPVDTGELVDINTIPVSLIDSVEIATGGASVAYGSGAVAGTVNFKLREIEGPTAGATSAFTERGDGRRSEANLGYGTEFADNRGHVSLFGEYLNRRPLLASGRSFSHFEFTDDLTTNQLVPFGSSAVPGGFFESFTDEFFGLGTNYGLIATFPAPGGVSRPFDFGSPANPLGDFYNFEPDNYLMIPQERWFVRGQADYEISPAARIYGALTYTDNKTAERLAPTPVFTEVLVDLNAVAPYLSASDLAQLQLISTFEEIVFGGPPGFVDLGIRYRTTQLGPRRYRQNRHAWHGLLGVTGELGPLTYDISYSYARTRTKFRSTGDVNQLAFNELVSNGGCNVFGPNLLSDSCISAISLPLSDNERIREQIGLATLSGPLFTLPSSTKRANFVVGAEWHSMRGAYTPDPNREISSTNTGASAKGHYDSEELFAELAVPLVDIAEIDGGARYSHYSLSNIDSAWSWYAGAKITPLPDVTLRGSYQRSIRAPRISELFAAPILTFPFVMDPCSFFGDPSSDAVRQSCIAAGVPPAEVFNFGYFPLLPTALGGNSDLREEKGDSWTVGVVLKPRFIPRLSASIDYFNLRLRNTITTMGGQQIVDACHLVTQDPSSPFCQRITRDPATGEIVAIDATVINFGSRRSSGIDAVVGYVMPLHASLTRAGHSTLAWQLAGTWLNKSNERFIGFDGLQTNKCAGRFGVSCFDPKPRWRWQSRISWSDGPLTTSLRWRHTGSVRDDGTAGDFVVKRIGSYDLFDLALEARVNDRFTARLGVNNLFDKHPPILGGNAAFGGGNTYPSTYDILGRDFFVSADMRF